MINRIILNSIIAVLQGDINRIACNGPDDEGASEFAAEVNSIIEVCQDDNANWPAILNAAANVGHREDVIIDLKLAHDRGSL